MTRPHYAPGVPDHIEPPTQPLSSLLENAVAHHGDRVAIDFIGKETTYQELSDQVTKAAAMLSLAGVRKGDVVAVALPNCPQHITVAYATWALGATLAEHNPLASDAELLAQLENHGANVIVGWENTISRIADRLTGKTVIAVDLTSALPFRSRMLLKLPLRAAREQRAKMRARVPEFVHSYEKLLESAPGSFTAVTPDLDSVAVYLHTGGTTGTPRAACLTHRNIMSNYAQIRAWLPMMVDGKETIGAVLPFFHAFGLGLSLVLSIGLSATIMALPQFDPHMLLASNRRHPFTFFGGVPPMYDRILDAMGPKDSFERLKYSVSGAMALDPDLATRWEKATKSLIIEGYGMTEASPVISGSPVSEARRPSTLGLPFPSVDVRIVDPENITEDVAPGEVGELLVKGPNVFAGYLDDEEETEATLLPGGWLRTGDLVRMEDSFLVMADRKKELIINSGFNIYPSQVEEAVRSMPEVRDVAVVGLPDGPKGETVVAALVLEPGTTVTLDQVRRWTEHKISHYAMPKSIAILDSLPRSQIGKVMRRTVKEQLAEWELQAGQWRERVGERAEELLTKAQQGLRDQLDHKDKADDDDQGPGEPDNS